MTEPAKDFWARADRDLLDRWPKDEAGAPEPAAKLDIQWELDSQADITVSFLESCGIPAFQNGSLGKVLGGFASQGVEGPRLPTGGGPGAAEHPRGNPGAGLMSRLRSQFTQQEVSLAWIL